MENSNNTQQSATCSKKNTEVLRAQKGMPNKVLRTHKRMPNKVLRTQKRIPNRVLRAQKRIPKCYVLRKQYPTECYVLKKEYQSVTDSKKNTEVLRAQKKMILKSSVLVLYYQLTPYAI